MSSLSVELWAQKPLRGASIWELIRDPAGNGIFVRAGRTKIGTFISQCAAAAAGFVWHHKLKFPFRLGTEYGYAKRGPRLGASLDGLVFECLPRQCCPSWGQLHRPAMRRDSWWRVSHHNHGALKINIELNKATKIYATWCILESRPYSIHQTLSFTLWGHSWWTLLRHEARVMTYGRLSVTRGHSGLSNDPACSQTSFSTIPFNSVWVWSDITDNSAHIGGVFPWQDIIIVSPKKYSVVVSSNYYNATKSHQLHQELTLCATIWTNHF